MIHEAKINGDFSSITHEQFHDYCCSARLFKDKGHDGNKEVERARDDMTPLFPLSSFAISCRVPAISLSS